MTATTLRQALAEAERTLAEAGVPSPRADAELLAAHALGCRRGDLLLRMSDQVPAALEVMVDRRAHRVPLQHLTGSAGFRRLDLQVGPGVFVPRPETEHVVGWAIDWLLADAAPRPVVVDLCAGSGAMALAVADEVPGAQVHAVEVDPDACVWLRRNAAGSPVRVHPEDLRGCLPWLDGSVDLVVSNPPYIPDGMQVRDPEVARHDPPLALWGGADGLDLVREVERAAARLLRPGGAVVVEHADLQGEAAPEVFRATGRWVDVRDHVDLAGRDRFVTACLVGQP